MKFDPSKSTEIPSRAIQDVLGASGAKSRDEDSLLARDIEYATRLRWDVTLELATVYEAQKLERTCQERGLGRVRLVGATWGNPWAVSDRLMLKRRRHREDQEMRRAQLSETTRAHLSFA